MPVDVFIHGLVFALAFVSWPIIVPSMNTAVGEMDREFLFDLGCSERVPRDRETDRGGRGEQPVALWS